MVVTVVVRRTRPGLMSEGNNLKAEEEQEEERKSPEGEQLSWLASKIFIFDKINASSVQKVRRRYILAGRM